MLVLTIDPAKRLATALGLDSVANAETRVDLGRSAPADAELWVAMLDTSASWDSLVGRHAPDAATAEQILANPLYRNITQRFVQSHDYIALERLYELDRSGRYDLIVIDTPPSRHALDFLDAPKRMAEFFSSSLLRWITLPYRVGGERAGRLGYLAAKPFYQVADRILGSQFLQDIAQFFLLFQSMYDGFVQRSDAVASLLRDERTTFVVVSTTEPAPLYEAEFLLAELAKRRLHRGALVLNRVVPSDIENPLALALATRIDTDGPPGGLSASQARVLDSMARTYLRLCVLADQEATARRRLASFADIVVTLAEQPGDIGDVASLARLGDGLWRS